MEFPGMDFSLSSQKSKTEALPSPGGPIEFIKSLWSDPFKWQLVKSFVVFGGAIYIAREISSFQASIKAEGLT